MKHDRFIGYVQDRAHLPSRGAAEGATRATLETLGERLPDHLAEKIASQLPPEIGEHLRRYMAEDKSGTGQHFGFDEFAYRVAQREHTDEPSAIYHSRVVLELVGRATTGSVMDKVRDALPSDLRPLVDSGSTGHLPHH
ncbi:DUF2267 domain-containing protein [Glycomyces sp. L485]|uniref:DUF2267 domain-containing protein n=1 Tax=Glycomyces sp. L485 TaxID=2909235 RepID=UPI001F4B2F42|nr:DUF2267 domain-containing protein [Glycomyces sp. L485]MCH7231922.1 DUF2267 domain-containing protein [Glycomyces sp. L485]